MWAGRTRGGSSAATAAFCRHARQREALSADARPHGPEASGTRHPPPFPPPTPSRGPARSRTFVEQPAASLLQQPPQPPAPGAAVPQLLAVRERLRGAGPGLAGRGGTAPRRGTRRAGRGAGDRRGKPGPGLAPHTPSGGRGARGLLQRRAGRVPRWRRCRQSVAAGRAEPEGGLHAAPALRAEPGHPAGTAHTVSRPDRRGTARPARSSPPPVANAGRLLLLLLLLLLHPPRAAITHGPNRRTAPTAAPRRHRSARQERACAQ